MKNLILLVTVLLTSYKAINAQSFGSTAGQEAAFNAKYKLTASINENTMTLTWSTNASISKAVLSVYTKEQLAVRKGTDHSYPFKDPVSNYQFNLNSPAYKGFYAYWLKVYTTDGLWQEYFFRKKETGNETKPLKPIGDIIEGMEQKDKDGFTIINTNINCAAGKTKVYNALKELDGVMGLTIDIKTGKLLIKYSSDGTPYTTLLSIINENGFNANNKKTANDDANPCKEKTGLNKPVRIDPRLGKRDPVQVSSMREKIKLVKPVPGLNTDNASEGESFTLNCNKKTFKNCSLSFSNAASVDNSMARFISGSGSAFIHFNTGNNIEEGYYFFEVTVDIQQTKIFMIENWPVVTKESIAAPTSGKQTITFMQKIPAGKSAVKITTINSDWKFYSCTVTKINL